MGHTKWFQYENDHQQTLQCRKLYYYSTESKYEPRSPAMQELLEMGSYGQGMSYPGG